ncbi:MAG: hypothetical protein ACPGUY_10665, partial [Akkermansiaceae bacterium]
MLTAKEPTPTETMIKISIAILGTIALSQACYSQEFRMRAESTNYSLTSNGTSSNQPSLDIFETINGVA